MSAYLSHEELVIRAERWLRNTKKCGAVLTELVTDLSVIPDAVGWKGHWSIYVECKASRGDFLSDRKKLIHKLPDSAPGHERWYLCNPGVASVDDLPAGWGLAEVRGKVVRVLRKPDPVELNVRRMRADVTLLVSALRRQQEHERLLRESTDTANSIKSPSASTPIIDFLNIRLCWNLLRYQIDVLGDFQKMTRSELEKVDDFGPARVNKVARLLDRAGLSFRGEP